MRFFLEIPKVLFPIWLNFIVVEDWEDFSISPRNYVRDLLYFYSWFRIFFFIEFRIFFYFSSFIKDVFPSLFRIYILFSIILLV
jgi:hypothetical protein